MDRRQTTISIPLSEEIESRGFARLPRVFDALEVAELLALVPAHRRVIHIEYCSARLPDILSWRYG